jgi:hypothetical protein
MVIKYIFTVLFISLNYVYCQNCRPMCCDAIVSSISPPGKIGLNCVLGGIDCSFSGQVDSCCIRFSPIGANSGTAIGCQ